AGVAALARSEALPRLRELRLANVPAPEHLVQAVEARYRSGGPPFEHAPPAVAPLAAPSAPLIGHPDEDGLVRAIWADPFDEVARRVYADWLEEQSSPDHAALLHAAGRKAALERITVRMRTDAPGPFAPTLTEEGLLGVQVPVRSLRSKAFERYGRAWLRRHHVSVIHPEGTPRDWAGLLAAEWLGHVRGLSFQGRAFDAFKGLASSPQVAGLASLV